MFCTCRRRRGKKGLILYQRNEDQMSVKLAKCTMSQCECFSAARPWVLRWKQAQGSQQPLCLQLFALSRQDTAPSTLNQPGFWHEHSSVFIILWVRLQPEMLIKIAGNYTHFLIFLLLCYLNLAMTLDLAADLKVNTCRMWLLKVPQISLPGSWETRD